MGDAQRITGTTGSDGGKRCQHCLLAFVRGEGQSLSDFLRKKFCSRECANASAKKLREQTRCSRCKEPITLPFVPQRNKLCERCYGAVLRCEK